MCDNIGIVINGGLQCVGTSQRLKSRFGSGYMLELQTEENPEAIARVKAFVQSLVAAPRLDEEFGGKMRYALPRGQFSLPHLFRQLVVQATPLQLRDFSLSQSTLEQIFIAFAKKQELASE